MASMVWSVQSLTDGDRNAMHRVVHIPVGVPGNGMRLADAVRVGRLCPNLVISGLGKCDRGAPVLPGICVDRLVETGLNPRRAEIDREADGIDRAVSGPRVPAHLQRPLGCRVAGGRMRDQRLDRHGFNNDEVFRGYLLSRRHEPVGNPIGCAGHFRTVMNPISQPDAGQPFLRA